MADSFNFAPRIAFLGVCERATLVRSGHPELWSHNFIGLRNILIHYFYPSSFQGWSLVFAIYDPDTFRQAHIRFLDECDKELWTMNFELRQRSDKPNENSARERRTWQLVAREGPLWFLAYHPLQNVVIRQPGKIKVLLRTEEITEEICIGTFVCAEVAPPPLTEDRITAIRAEPNGSRYVRVLLVCKKCQSKVNITAGIDRPAYIDGKENIWYEDAPDNWTCKCGLTVINLTSIRKNLHGYLGRRLVGGEENFEISFIRMYEKGSLSEICGDFGALLDDKPPEEEVQKFLEKSPVFLHRFSPMRIKPKAPVLTKYKTDFAILDSRGILNLVEIERPNIKLLKKDGDVTQDLQHAFDQVRHWLHTTKRRWTAVLDCMGFKEDEVAGMKGIVVAGRNSGYPSEDLMRLKGADHGQIEFYTYDDLLEDTISLSRDLP